MCIQNLEEYTRHKGCLGYRRVCALCNDHTHAFSSQIECAGELGCQMLHELCMSSSDDEGYHCKNWYRQMAELSSESLPDFTCVKIQNHRTRRDVVSSHYLPNKSLVVGKKKMDINRVMDRTGWSMSFEVLDLSEGLGANGTLKRQRVQFVIWRSLCFHFEVISMTSCVQIQYMYIYLPCFGVVQVEKEERGLGYWWWYACHMSGYYYYPKHTDVSASLWLCINMGYAYINVYYYNNILWAELTPSA